MYWLQCVCLNDMSMAENTTTITLKYTFQCLLVITLYRKCIKTKDINMFFC